jgi:hypothetical protein
MWCPQHNQYCYEDTCPHGGPRPAAMPWKPPPYPATPTEREALAKRQAALGVTPAPAPLTIERINANIQSAIDASRSRQERGIEPPASGVSEAGGQTFPRQVLMPPKD